VRAHADQVADARCCKLLLLTKGAIIDVAVVWAGAPVALTAKEAKKAAKAEKKLQKHGGRGAAALATPTFEQEVSSRPSPLQAPAPEPLMTGGFRSGAVDAQEQMRCAPPPPPLPPGATVPALRRWVPRLSGGHPARMACMCALLCARTIRAADRSGWMKTRKFATGSEDTFDSGAVAAAKHASAGVKKGARPIDLCCEAGGMPTSTSWGNLEHTGLLPCRDEEVGRAEGFRQKEGAVVCVRAAASGLVGQPARGVQRQKERNTEGSHRDEPDRAHLR
jgi:hypothetical protein